MMTRRRNENSPEDVFTSSRKVVLNPEPERLVCIVTKKSIGRRSANRSQLLENAEKYWRKRIFVSIAPVHLIEHQIAEVPALARIVKDDTIHQFVMFPTTYQNLKQD
jgi:hypothetical protein